jgi:hypothetical protein
MEKLLKKCLEEVPIEILDERIKGLLLHDEYGLFKKNLYLI